ncbi:MAG: alpha/beta hydrolase [Candidatus Hydrogenedentes bacterium]|nr:alpha/beta hydrolase [Candidatus Hydrogenedentota bacterium]
MNKVWAPAFVLVLEILGVNAFATEGYKTERGIVFADLGSKKLRMTMYLPETESATPRPGMVLIHGGAWILGTRYQQSWYCREFARNGYVVMTIDYRLMPTYAFPDCLHDCKAAVRWLRLNANTYNVDPDRIVTFGASAGGHLAALLAATSPKDRLEGEINPGASSEVRAAISLYGAVDLTRYRDRPLKGFLHGRTEHFFKDFTSRNMSDKTASTLEAASPLTYAGPDTKPIIFVHGTSDKLVHYDQSVRFFNRLKECGVPTELVTLKNRGHGFDYIFWKQRREVFRKMLAFLNQQGCAPAQVAERNSP